MFYFQSLGIMTRSTVQIRKRCPDISIIQYDFHDMNMTVLVSTSYPPAAPLSLLPKNQSKYNLKK